MSPEIFSHRVGEKEKFEPEKAGGIRGGVVVVVVVFGVTIKS